MAERDLVIRVQWDSAQAEADAANFWGKVRQGAQGAGQGGGGGFAGGGGAGGAGGGGFPPGAFGGGLAPQAPMAAAGVLPGMVPGLAAAGQLGNAAAGGALPGMMIPAPAIGAAAQLGGVGGPGAMAALPAPPGGGALQQVGAFPAPGPVVGQFQGQQILAPGGGAGGGAIPIRPTPLPGRPGAPGAGGAAGGGFPAAGGLVLVAGGLEVLKTLQDAGLRSNAEARQHIDGLVDDAARARFNNREIAALRGLPNTAATAAQMAQEASNAGISSDQWRDFQTGFQAFGGQYVGDGKKFSEAQATRLQQVVAGFGVGKKGWSGADASRLLATIMSRAKDGATDEQILGQYGQLAEVMQLAPGYTGPLLGQLAEVVSESVGEGAEFDDPLAAAVLLRGESERNPRTASAYTRAVLRGLRRARLDPQKAQALGLQAGMNPFEQLTAIDAAARRAGGDENAFLEANGFSEIRQFGGIRAALTYGIRGGAFDRARAEAGDRSAMAGRVREEFRGYTRGEEGSFASDAAALEAARLERASRAQEWDRFRRKAAISLIGSGDLEEKEPDVQAWLTQSGGSPSQMTRSQQEAHAEAVRQLQMALQGSEAGRRYLAQPADPGQARYAMGGTLPTRNDYLESHRRDGSEKVFIEMSNELKRIRAESERQTRILESRRDWERTGAFGAAAGAAAYGAVLVQMPGAMDGR